MPEIGRSCLESGWRCNGPNARSQTEDTAPPLCCVDGVCVKASVESISGGFHVHEVWDGDGRTKNHSFGVLSPKRLTPPPSNNGRQRTGPSSSYRMRRLRLIDPNPGRGVVPFRIDSRLTRGCHLKVSSRAFDRRDDETDETDERDIHRVRTRFSSTPDHRQLRCQTREAFTGPRCRTGGVFCWRCRTAAAMPAVVLVGLGPSMRCGSCWD